MKILMSLIITFLSGFTSLAIKPNVVSEKYDEFISNIYEYYESYDIQYEEKENYTLAVIEGICNNELTFGVFFGSIESGAYSVRVIIDEKEYSLPKDNRNDTIAYCVKHPSEVTTIEVYDTSVEDGNSRCEISLKYESITTYRYVSSVSIGKNSGCSLTKLSREYKFSTIVTVAVCICLAVIGISVITIFYLKKTKKGIFNPENKHHTDFSFFEKEEENEDDNEVIEVENTNVTVEENPQEIYNKVRYFDDDDDFDIKPFLSKKGYKTEYNEMTEEEKNETMIYLMTLRHLGKITEKQCREEEIKLWKK